MTFRASLRGSLGDRWPELELYHIFIRDAEHECGFNVDLAETPLETTLRLMKRALFDTLNFFFAPVFEFGKKGKDKAR